MLFTKYSTEEINLMLEVGKMKRFSQYDDNQFIQIAKKLPIFQNLKDSDIASIMLNCKFLKFKNNQLIIKDGIVSSEIFYLASGKINILLGERVVKVVEAGNIFGLGSFVTKEPLEVSITSHGSSAVMSFNTNLQVTTESKAYTYFLFYKNISKYLSSKIKSISKSMGYI